MDEATEALDRFVAASRPGLLRQARQLTADPATAEDLVQATLERIVLAWDRIRAAEAAGAYSRRVMVTTWVTWRRRRWHGELPTSELPERAYEDAASRVDTAIALQAALDRLPLRSRQVLLLRYVEDVPEADVARLLGCSVTSVRGSAARALARLRADPGLLELAGERGEPGPRRD